MTELTPSRQKATDSPQLLFCAVCQVSIPVAELQGGTARRTPKGRIFCSICTRATPDERLRRRASLEAEFADDAPLPHPVAARGAPARVAPARVSPQPPTDAEILPARVGELERAAFRMQARIEQLEERLETVLRVLNGRSGRDGV